MKASRGFYLQCGKRSVDLLLAIPALFLLSPVFALLMILVRWKLGSPVFFRQQRPGLHGKHFTLYKFRTMTDARNTQGNLLPDAERLTTFGHFLRSTSFDELPEILNVIKGEMSLVGPRPLMVRYLDRYTDAQMHRHDVRPGVTGWAQINGRNSISWAQRFELDLWYVANYSFRLDIIILARTIYAVFRREGISSQGHATMPEFQDTEQ